MNHDDRSDRSSPPSNDRDAPIVDAVAEELAPPAAASSSKPAALVTAGAWPPPSPSNATAPVYAQPGATAEPPRQPQPTPVYAHPAYGQPPVAPYAQPPQPYAAPAPAYAPQAQYAPYAQPAQPYVAPQQYPLATVPQPPPYAQPAQPYAPPPYAHPYAPQPAPMAPPYAPQPYAQPATVVQVVVQQQAPMPMMQYPMAMPSAMVPYGYGQAQPAMPAGVVRVGNANRIVFAILAFLLGWVGIHKFYQGKPVWGLIYMLTVWTGVPAIVSVIEGLIALFQTDAAFDADNNLRSI